jgi:hypothetical protein
MASDAQINQIEVLSSFAVGLANFSESITSNSNAFVVLMSEKLSDLRLIEKKADDICQQIIAERKAMFHDYASIAGLNDYGRHNYMLAQLQDAEQKEREAKRLLAIIHQNVLVAHGAVIAMVDKTKQFDKEINNNVEKGVSFLKHSQANLEEYKSHEKSI